MSNHLCGFNISCLPSDLGLNHFLRLRFITSLTQVCVSTAGGVCMHVPYDFLLILTLRASATIVG